MVRRFTHAQFKLPLWFVHVDGCICSTCFETDTSACDTLGLKLNWRILRVCSSMVLRAAIPQIRIHARIRENYDISGVPDAYRFRHRAPRIQIYLFSSKHFSLEFVQRDIGYTGPGRDYTKYANFAKPGWKCARDDIHFRLPDRSHVLQGE